jgi:hypothetical protein
MIGKSLYYEILLTTGLSITLKKFPDVGCHVSGLHARYLALTTGTPRNPGLSERSQNPDRSDRSVERDRSSEFSLISQITWVPG